MSAEYPLEHNMEDTCNVDHISGTDVDNVAGTDVDHVAGTDVDHVAGTDVYHVAGTDVDNVAGTDVDNVAGTDVDQRADGANEAGMPGSIEKTTSVCRSRSSAILIPALSTMDASPLTTAAAPYKTYSTNFQVDSSMIQSVDTSQQAAELQNLGLSVFNQDQFEMGVMAQVDEAFAKEEKERLQKRLRKEMQAVNDDIRKVDEELKRINSLVRKYTSDGVISDNMVSMHRQRENKLKQMKSLRAKERSLLKKLSGNSDLLNTDEALQCASDRTMNEVLGLNLGTTTINETESERLVRVGEMTPFGTIIKPPTEPKASTSKLTEFELFLTGQDAKMKQKAKPKSLKRKVVSRSSLISDSFSAEPPSKGEGNFFDATKPRRVRSEGDARQRSPCRPKRAKLPHNFASDHELSDSGRVGSSDDDGDGDEYLPTKDEWRDSSDDCRPFGDLPPDERGPKIRKQKRKKSPSDSSRVKSPGWRCNKDDGSYTAYQRRLSRHRKDHLKRKHERILNSEEEIEDESDVEIDDDFKCPSEIWNKLYR